MVIIYIKYFHLNNIEEEAHDCDNHHNSAYYRLRRDNSESGLVEKPDGEHPYGEDADQCADDLSPVVPVAHVRSGGFLRTL